MQKMLFNGVLATLVVGILSPSANGDPAPREVLELVAHRANASRNLAEFVDGLPMNASHLKAVRELLRKRGGEKLPVPYAVLESDGLELTAAKKILRFSLQERPNPSAVLFDQAVSADDAPEVIFNRILTLLEFGPPRTAMMNLDLLIPRAEAAVIVPIVGYGIVILGGVLVFQDQLEACMGRRNSVTACVFGSDDWVLRQTLFRHELLNDPCANNRLTTVVRKGSEDDPGSMRYEFKYNSSSALNQVEIYDDRGQLLCDYEVKDFKVARSRMTGTICERGPGRWLDQALGYPVQRLERCCRGECARAMAKWVGESAVARRSGTKEASSSK